VFPKVEHPVLKLVVPVAIVCQFLETLLVEMTATPI
jgi:hypothetical protein